MNCRMPDLLKRHETRVDTSTATAPGQQRNACERSADNDANDQRYGQYSEWIPSRAARARAKRIRFSAVYILVLS